MNKNTVNPTLTPDRRSRPPRQQRRDIVENGAYAAFARRIIRAHGRRIATGDVEALADLVRLSLDVDDAIQAAVVGLRAFGYSWAEIGQRLGITRQAAQQRFGGDR